MRPIVSEQNSLRYPLNELLGTEAHVRLLRVMANEVNGPLTASDAAKRAGLTVPGAQKALRRLFRSGFVSRVGGGRKHQYEICRSYRLVKIALELFRAEKDRYEQRIPNCGYSVLRLFYRNVNRKLTPHDNPILTPS